MITMVRRAVKVQSIAVQDSTGVSKLLIRDMLLVGGRGKPWQEELAMCNTATGPLQGSGTLSAHGALSRCASCMPLRPGTNAAGSLPPCILHQSGCRLPLSAPRRLCCCLDACGSRSVLAPRGDQTD